MDAILRNLERRLEVEPLLELASGRLISVDVARKARPQELAHLDIWDPSGPELDPSERARLLLGEDAAPVVEAKAEPELEPEPERPDDPDALPGDSKPEPASDEPVALEFLDEHGKVVPPEPKRDFVGETLERVREKLRLLRERHELVLCEGQLDAISADDRFGTLPRTARLC